MRVCVLAPRLVLQLALGPVPELVPVLGHVLVLVLALGRG